jgi:hypothetical protein
MISHKNDVIIFSLNTQVRIKISLEFFHWIIYITNKGRHVIIILFTLLDTFWNYYYLF